MSRIRIVAMAALLALPAAAQDAAEAEADVVAGTAPGVQAPAEDPAGMLGTTDGAAIYRQVCQGCHMPDGRGAEGAGRYPAFAGSTTVASADFVALTVLQGRRNMPSFDRDTAPALFFPPTWLSDEQVAAVANFVRSNFGNAYPDRLTAADVSKLRSRTKEAKP